MRLTKGQWAGVFFLIAGILVILSLAGCSSTSKYQQPYNDAPVGGHDTSLAKTIDMPDGFSNVAFKCVGHDGVYVIFHKDSPYGSVSVVGNDRACE